jgi:hypothetical protein
MSAQTHLAVLKHAAEGTLPQQIDETSEVPINLVQELVTAGYLKAIDASSFDGPAFVDPKITLSGREYLRTLESRAREASISGKAAKLFPPFAKWLIGIFTAVGTAILIKWFVG